MGHLPVGEDSKDEATGEVLLPFGAGGTPIFLQCLFLFLHVNNFLILIYWCKALICVISAGGGQDGAWSSEWPSFGQSKTPGRHSDRISIPDPMGKTRSASLRREESPFSGYIPTAKTGSVPCSGSLLAYADGSGGVPGSSGGAGLIARLTDRKDILQQRIQLQFPDLPPELRGVSVQDLVKALGELQISGKTY